MAWLAKSLANSLRIPDELDADADADDDEEEEEEEVVEGSALLFSHQSAPASATQGVRDDISDLTSSLSRQLRGVASFLAPSPHDSSDPNPGESAVIGNLVDETQGIFPGGISPMPPFGSNIDDEEEEEEEDEEGWDVGDAIGITDEVLTFASNISMHPETWLDFPLLPDEDEPDGLFQCFDMSETQQEHAMVVEQLLPRLAALRIELCPIHMSEECFWKIYFVLLHPRLNKHDAELLSTPQIVQARAELLQQLQNSVKLTAGSHLTNLPYKSDDGMIPPGGPSAELKVHFGMPDSNGIAASSLISVAVSDLKMDQQPNLNTSTTNSDNEQAAIQLHNIQDDAPKNTVEKYDNDEDDDNWFNNESNFSGDVEITVGDAEDVSFSDLEEDCV